VATSCRDIRGVSILVTSALAALFAFACDRGRDGAPVHAPTLASTRPPFVPPPIDHVFLIVLENTGFDSTFGPRTGATYLADTMVRNGAKLTQYYAIGHSSLDNYIAMVSGIAPDHETQNSCVRYDQFVQTGTAPDGQPIGRGCVYPASVLTIANQLEARHLTWKGYMEDMGKDPAREAARCAHPALGSIDSTQRAQSGDQYTTRHNPFVYFHAITDFATCQANVVPLTRLAADLGVEDSTPNFAFIVPNLCHDAHDPDRPYQTQCADSEPGGLVSANQFLSRWVPSIIRARAFHNGLLIVTFDEAEDADVSACCDEPSGPNTAQPGRAGPGGGRVGAVLLSRFIKPGTVSNVPYNHYALLRSVEDIFSLSHLGYAGRPGLASFGRDVYTAATPSR